MSKNKFRALIEGNTGFFYGGYYAEGDTEYIVCSPFLLAKAIPGTVGQYSDMEDKNGIEIYEGDIIKAHYANALNDDFIEIVVFYKGRFSAQYAKGSPRMPIADGIQRCSFEKSVYMTDCEVIGNIHENPELVKDRIYEKGGLRDE